MHIGLWSPAWPLGMMPNGILTYAHWMKQGFEELGHRVSIFTRCVDGVPDPAIHDVQPSRWRRLRHRLAGDGIEQRVLKFADTLAPAVARVHRRDPLDVLEMEESFGWFAGIQQHTGVPVVVKLHGPAFLSLVGDELNSSFARHKIQQEGDALRRAQVIVSPSRDTLERTVEYYRLAPPLRRCIVNPLAMMPDTPLWSLQGCDLQSILFVGRFDERKGADVLLQAFASLRRERPGLRLIFVGPEYGLPNPTGGKLSFAAYRDRLFDAGSRSCIEFRGSLPAAQIAQLRARAAVTVIASRWESQGYTLLEAMLQGCPVVCTDAGACPESVTDGVNGRLAKSGDAGSFARGIAAMLDDPQAAARMGQAARAWVQQWHAPRRVATEALALYADARRERLSGGRPAQHGIARMAG